MKGQIVRKELDMLARHFDEIAMPARGRYIGQPAVTNENGVQFLPPKTEIIPTPLKVIGASVVGLFIGVMIYSQLKRRSL